MAGRRVPFLKWVGGKRKLAPFIYNNFIKDELNGIYFEPFLGAGAVFLEVNPQKAILSDINKELIDSLKIISSFPEEVIHQIEGWDNTRNCYEKVRDLVSEDPVVKAARFLYLNRTCFSGIYRTNKKGEFNVPFGNNGREIIDKDQILSVSTYYSNATLLVQDFSKTIVQAQKGDVVYVDPPYILNESENAFNRYNKRKFQWNDQMRLAKSCNEAKKRGALVIISAVNSKNIKALFPGWYYLILKKGITVKSNNGSVEVPEILITSRVSKKRKNDIGRFIKKIKK